MSKNQNITQSTLDSLSDNIVIINQEGIIKYTNKKWDNFAKNNGLKAKAVGPGTNYLKAVKNASGKWSDEAPQALEGINKVINGQKNEFTLEYPCHSPDTKRWFRMRVTPYKGKEPFAAVIVHENITEKKLAELKLQNNKNKFQNYIDKAPIAIIITNVKGNIIETNNTTITLTDYEKNKLLNMSIFDFNIEKNNENLKEKLKNLKKDNIFECECKLEKADNNKIFVEINAVKLKSERILFFMTDINARKHTKRVLQRQKAYFQQLFDKSPNGIALLDNDERIIRVNKSFEELFGYKQTELEGRMINHVILPEDRLQEGKEISARVKDGEIFTGESIRKTKSGRKINVSISGYPITWENKRLGIYAIYKNITARKEEEKKIKFLSFHDQMTGLYNRRYFENEMNRLNDSRKLPISILIADIDDLKKINDNFGHKKGDRFIKLAADILNNATRTGDIVARIGGDEFAIILPSTSSQIAVDIKSRIQNRCRDYHGWLDYPLTLSVGFATKTKKSQNINEIFRSADHNMYENKQMNKNSDKNRKEH